MAMFSTVGRWLRSILSAIAAPWRSRSCSTANILPSVPVSIDHLPERQVGMVRRILSFVWRMHHKMCDRICAAWLCTFPRSPPIQTDREKRSAYLAAFRATLSDTGVPRPASRNQNVDSEAFARYMYALAAQTLYCPIYTVRVNVFS
jgi:hypothetical protein